MALVPHELPVGTGCEQLVVILGSEWEGQDSALTAGSMVAPLWDWPQDAFSQCSVLVLCFRSVFVG